MRSPLTSAAELASALGGTAAPSVLDVRWELATGPDRAAYLAGHVPGAAFVDLDHDLADPPGRRGRHPLPQADAFGRSMRAAGVSGTRPVVVYDAASSTAAARAWWLLRFFGHDRVSVLDGGLRAWTEAGLELELEPQPIEAGDFAPRPGGMPLLDAAGAAAVARDGLLLDARAPERFRGELEPIDPVAGHIPGAVNRPTTLNVSRSGAFRDAGELRHELARAGARDGVEIGAYCGSGVTAAHQVLALELAGYRAALYAGSWSEWITDPRRPVAGGKQTAAP